MWTSLRKWIALGTLAGALANADNTNQPTLNMQSNKIDVNTTIQTRTYSLLESTNLVDWTEALNQRGTESNLVFNIDSSSPAKFYKTISNYEPIEPASIHLSLSDGQHGGACAVSSGNYNIMNYETNNIEVRVDFVPNISVGGYVSNAPFTNTLAPGTNSMNLFLGLQGCNYGTVFTIGDFVITRLE